MDPLRNEYAPPNSPLINESPRERSPLDTQAIEELLAGFVPEQTLPTAQNPRLNRTAESIGAALGTTVGKMRHGLSLVQSRQREVTGELAERVSQRTESLSAAMTEGAQRIGDLAEVKASEFVDMAQARWDEASLRARRRIMKLREEAATLRNEHPLELVLAFAGAAFALGFALRIWRSNDD